MQSKSLSLKSLVYLGKFLAMGTTLSEQEIGRRESLQKLRALGIDPYPAAAYDVSIYSKDCKAHYEEGKKVCLLSGFGAGFSFATCLTDITNTKIFKIIKNS